MEQEIANTGWSIIVLMCALCFYQEPVNEFQYNVYINKMFLQSSFVDIPASSLIKPVLCIHHRFTQFWLKLDDFNIMYTYNIPYHDTKTLPGCSSPLLNPFNFIHNIKCMFNCMCRRDPTPDITKSTTLNIGKWSITAKYCIILLIPMVLYKRVYVGL